MKLGDKIKQVSDALEFTALSTENSVRQFGIRVSLPENDPLAAAHLLGDDWAGERWYTTSEERDRAFNSMQTQPPYYRQGDAPSIVLEKIER